MHPIAFQASLHRWDLFVTLTYKSRHESGAPLKVPDERSRARMLFAFLRELAKGRMTNRNGEPINRLPFRFLRWVAREEIGERNGRYHWHILVEGLPASRLNHTERFVIKSIWNDVGGGFSDVRVFDARLPGVSYVMKGLRGWSQSHANAYEMGKFADDQKDRTLILSASFTRLWGSASRYAGASGGSCDPKARASRPSDIREGVRRFPRTKEVAAIQGRLRHEVYNQHPAGTSLVR
jgi:hypothetical protein